MKTLTSTLALLIAVGFAIAAQAHGGGPHLMGTVKSIDAKSVVVADADGKETTAAIDDKTTVEQSGKAVTVKDVKAGERVVVHTRKTDAGLVAVMIKFGKSDKTAPHHDGAEHHDGQPTK